MLFSSSLLSAIRYLMKSIITVSLKHSCYRQLHNFDIEKPSTNKQLVPGFPV